MSQTHESRAKPGQAPILSRVSTPRAPAPGGPYAQAICAGSTVYLSGQRPVDPATGAIPGRFAEQANTVLGNLMQVLSAAGSSAAQIVKVTAYLADLSCFDEFNGIYEQYFSPPYPARTTIGARLRGILIEIDAIAVRRLPP